MEQIYNAILARLQKTVPCLKWIDLDTGQLDDYAQRPPVAFPCLLIDIELTDCQDLYPGVQLCNAILGIRIAQNPPASRTAGLTPKKIRQTELQRYQLVEDVYRALQSWENGLFNPPSRINQKRENRKDGLFVCRINFATMFKDT